MPGAHASFEVQSSSETRDDQCTIICYSATVGGFPFNIERHSDWLTTAYWTLPDEYSFEDVLGAMEATFVSAEEDGYTFEGGIPVDIGSPDFEHIEEVEFYRPLEAVDFETVGTSIDRVNFFRTNGDLAHFTYSKTRREVGLLIDEKPRQIKSAFLFMANLMPSALRLDPKRLGEFVLELPR